MSREKLNDKCEEMQLKFLKRPNDPTVREHLKTCRACSDFAALADGFVAVDAGKVVKTPALTSILEVRNNRIRRSFLHIAVTAVAASFVFTIAPALVRPSEGTPIGSASQLPQVATAVTADDETAELYAVTDPEELEFSWDLDGLDIRDDFESFQTAMNWNIPEL